MKYFSVLILVGMLHILIFAFIFPSHLYADQILGGDQHYFRYASRIVRGELPYHNFFVEYPPFALVPFTLPRLVSASPFVWERLYTWQILLWDLLGLGFITWASLQLGRSLALTLGMYTLGLVAIGPLITQRFDLVPAVLILMALTAYMDNRHKMAWGALTLSTLTKAYAAVIAPLFIIDLAMHFQPRQIAFGLALLSLIGLVILIAVTAFSPQTLMDFVTFHQQRGAEIESIYANLGLLAHIVTSAPLETSYEFMSVNASSPLVDRLVRYSLPITVLGLLALCALYYKHWNQPRRHRQMLVNYATGAILIFMVCNKVLSPQYLIWLLPLIPLTGSPMAAFMFVLAAALTTVLYPMNFGDLSAMAPWAVVTLTVRNVLLLALIIPVLGAAHIDSRKEHPASRLIGLMRQLEWLVLGGLVLAFPLIFIYPAPPNAAVHLPPDLDGDGILSERELYVTQRGGVDYDSDGVISDIEHRVFQITGLDANGDGLVDGDELRFFLREGPH
jgi:hypothetical protein